MATKIVTKNSSTASAVPTASDLVQGELAVNVADKRLFTEDNGGSIVELGTNPYNFTANHNGSAKLATTSTGIDVTGNVTMATGGSIVAGGVNDLILNAGESGTPDIYLQSGGSTKVKIEGSNGNVGINTTSPSANLEITQSGNNVGLLVAGGAYNYTAKFESSDAEANIIIEDSNSTNDGNMIGVATDDMYFLTAGSERMRIRSDGNVLIGKTADDNTTAGIRFHNAGYASFTIANDYPIIANRLSSDGPIAVFRKDGADVGSIGSLNGTYLYIGSTGGVDTFASFHNGGFRPATSTGVDNDAALNLGDSGGRWKDLYLSGNALVGRTSSLSSQSGSVSANTVVSAHGPLSSHATNAGILEYYNDETLLRSYGANAGSGKLVFKVGGGGGSADSEAMRITSDGKVGIGNSDPKRALVVAASDSAGVQTQYVNTTTGSALGDGFTVGINASEQAEFWNAENTAMLFATNNTERMRIDSAGAISVGSSTQAVTELQLNHENSGGKGELQLNAHGSASFSMLSNFTGSTVNGVATGGFGLITPHSYPISIVTNNLERMRIDASGNLLVGCSSAPTGSTGGSGFITESVGRKTLKIASTTTGGAGLAEFINPNGIVGSISTSGSATAFNTSSDQRLKENIADAPSASDDIDAIQVRSFDWKADGSHQKYGMVAQELQGVAPEAVSGDADSEDMMGVDYSKLVPMLIKEIQSLRNRVAQLEE